MTDKKHTDHNEDVLHKAFDKINLSDNLQPSAELDAHILQQANDELSKQAQLVSEREANLKITDISFRRNLARERQARIQKKSIFPAWAMPVGLAATVLISFGVVTRVMQSPEYKQTTGVEQSTAVFEDSSVISHTAEKQIESERIDAINNVNEQDSKRKNTKPDTQGATATLTVPAAAPPGFTRELTKDNAQNKVARESRSTLNSNQANLDLEVSSGSFGITLEEEVIDSPESQEDTVEAKTSSGALNVKNENAADRVSVKRSRLGITSPSQSQPLATSEVNSPVEESLGLNEMNVAQLSGETIEGLSDTAIQTDGGDTDVYEADDKFAPSILVTSSEQEPERIKQDDQAIKMAAAKIDPVSRVEQTDPGRQEPGILQSRELNEKIEINNGSDLLTQIIFEHRECKVSYDCSLVALECDSCDCIESVNLINLDKYDSRYNQDEIHNRCNNHVADCDLGFCQAKEVEIYLQ